METTMVRRLNMEPPRPGVWFLDPTHFSRPATRFHTEIFPGEFKRGFGDSLRRYGSLLEYLDWAFIEGLPYYCPRPVGAPLDAVGHPPRQVWDDMARSHPEIRQRLARSAEVFERKLWREDLDEFDRETKPAAVREHLALLAVDPDALSRDGLLAYLDRCRQNQKKCCYLHHWYNLATLVPTGDFLVHGQQWTGRPAAELLALLQGATPDPLGTAEELERLTRALRDDREGLARLRGDSEPAEVLAALRAWPGEVGRAAEAYVNRVGYRPVNGEDVGDPNVIEVPELIVEAIRGALEPGPSRKADELAQRTAEIRDDVPGQQRTSFDELLLEARRMYRLRDERGSYLDLWAVGIMRRALLAAGRRLMHEALIAQPSHAVEAGYDELRALLVGSGGPSADELAGRARFRSQLTYRDVPPVLGGAPGAPLPPDWLPPSAARLERALGAAVTAMFVAPAPQTERRRVCGLGVSLGVYEGPARVIGGPREFGRLRKGDVLVTNSTTTAFNIVLPLLGAIVTDRGGLLSHAAIVARELGIPAAVGCTDATQVIPDGARVRVDGRAGEAVVL